MMDRRFFWSAGPFSIIMNKIAKYRFHYIKGGLYEITVCFDSFKGTLSSDQIIKLLNESAQRIFPGCETVGVPVADGGEGTVDAVIAVTKGDYRKVKSSWTAHGGD